MLVVVAHDLDFRSRQLLGRQTLGSDQSRYRLEYTARRFARAEKHRADLLVSVLDQAGTVLAESKVLYNAPDIVEGLDLVIEQPEPARTAEPTEYDALLATLELIVEGVPPAAFTERDLDFLAEECQRRPSPLSTTEKRLLRGRLRLLSLADGWASETEIAPEIFYGGLRQELPTSLADFLALSAERVALAVRTSVEGSIVPRTVLVGLDAALVRRRAWRRAQGHERLESVLLHLVDAASGRALERATVAVVDLDGPDGPTPLGRTTADRRGIVQLRYPWASDARPEQRRRLALTLLDRAGEANAEAEIAPHPTTREPLDVRFEREVLAPDTPPLVGVFGRDVAERLARLDVASPLALARERRSEFVDRAVGTVDVEDADALHQAALTLDRTIHHVVVANWISAREPSDEGDAPELPLDPALIAELQPLMAILIDCRCEDCESALSPGAYLAQLLAWVLDHLRAGGQPITLTQLQTQMHQRFGEIPGDCTAVEERVRQVRLAIEVLRGFTDLPPADDDGDGPGVVLVPPPTEEAEGFAVDYRAYRVAAYRAILGAYGLTWETLRDARLANAAEQRDAVAARLGIRPDGIDAVFFDIAGTMTAVSEDSLAVVFGLPDTRSPFAERDTPTLLTRQRQRLAAVWQTLDLPVDDWGPEPLRPVVEPDVMSVEMIRDSAMAQAAAALYEARRMALDTERASLLALSPQTAGPEPLLAQTLGTDIATLRALQTDLGDAATVEATLEAITTFGLTPDGLGRLVDLADRFESIDTLVAEEIDDLLAILMRVHRRGRHQEWIGEESVDGIRLGPHDFVPRPRMQIPPAAFLATPAEREAWDRALAIRRRPPTIDPAVITASEIRQSADPGQENALDDAVRDAALELHETREETMNGRADALASARAAAVGAAAELDATLRASALGGGTALVDALAADERAGHALFDRLDALDLSASGYRLLRRLQGRIEDGLAPSVEDWARLDGELLALETRRLGALWRHEERERGVLLHPQLLRLRDDEDDPEVRTPARAARRRSVRDALEARARQDEGLAAALAQAVDSAEEQTISVLRDALIVAAPLDVTAFDARVERLEDRLMIDLRQSACTMTTRVAFAAETLARLARLVHGGEASSEFDHVSIDPEVFESEFPALHSYQSFRALALAYLYPEIALGDATPDRLSQGYARLLAESTGASTKGRACALGRAFSDYFADVSDLAVEATCQARTAAASDDPCSTAAAVSRSLCHMFARARASGRVYVSRFQATAGEADTQTAWERVEMLGTVDRIIGAIPHETATGARLIVLIVRADVDGGAQLQAIRFDLDTLFWHDPTPLALPPGASGTFEAVAIQKSGRIGQSFAQAPASEVPEMPSFVLVQPTDGVFYLRALNAEASGWGGVWHPLFGRDFALTFARPLALAQRSPESFVAYAEQVGSDTIWYRVLFEGNPHEDTGTWMRHGRGVFKGTLAWPTEDLHLYVLDGDAEETEISLLRKTDALQLRALGGASSLDGWLKSSCGVSLERFVFDGFRPAFFYPIEFPDTAVDVMTPGDVDVEDAPLAFRGFSGTLLDLLTLSPNEFGELFGTLPEEHWKVVGPSTRKKFVGAYSWRFLRAQLVDKGLDHFAERIAGIGKVDFTHGRLGDWKLADLYCRLFLRWSTIAQGPTRPDGVVHVLRMLADPRIETDLEEPDAPFPVFRPAELPVTLSRLHRRGPFAVDSAEGDQVLPLGTLATSPLHHVPAGFTDLFGTEPHRHVVYRGGNGGFRIDYTGRDAALRIRAVTPLRVTPQHEGPTDILPLPGGSMLQSRRPLVAAAYARLSGSPPSILMYLVEAYRLVPLRIARDLQEVGAYDEALAWYRLVYDYLAASGAREIDHGLVLERELELAFDELERWLGDTTNVHAIAATRRGTWTRHVVLAIAGCLTDQADALFATESPPDLVRAAELYERALDLLGHFGQPSSSCDRIIGRLEVDITDGIGRPVEELRVALARIGNATRLEALAAELRAVALDDDRSPRERLRTIRRRVGEAIAAEPKPPSVVARIDAAREIVRRTEVLALADRHVRESLTRVASSRLTRRRQATADIVSRRARRGGDRGGNWLRAAPTRPGPIIAVERAGSDGPPLVELAPMLSLAIAEPPPRPPPLSGLAVGFCIVQNPLVKILRGRAESNLEKLRHCRNIAGFERASNPYGGAIGRGVGIGRDGLIAARVLAPNTAYRYGALRARAVELVNEAEQVESRYQAALVAAEEAEFRELQFRQQARLTESRTRLADLRIDTAIEQVGLARLQQTAAAFDARTYAAWIDAGTNEHEQAMLGAYRDAEDAQLSANVARTTGATLQAAANAASAWSGNLREKVFNAPIAAAVSGLNAGIGAAAVLEGISNASSIRAQTDIQQSSFMASHARRNDEWQLQLGRAEHETRIAGQQITVARSQLRITRQEREIAALEQANAMDLLEYLIGMDFTAELYRWMAGVLGRIYRGFLQQATATARLAEAQLAWERQESPAGLIETDYWTVTSSATQAAEPEAASRLGLTGATRLKFDMQTLEQHAFDSRSRQDRFPLTLDLAQHAPIEFQRFRERGLMVFETPLELLARDFPGHYLCLVRSVTVALVALVPPTRGIRASLTSGGVTRVVSGGDVFPAITLNARPERVAFTGTAEMAGPVPLVAEEAALRGAFDGIGFAGRWQLEMQRAINPFDYDSIATVLVTFDLSSRFSFDYRRQLLETRDRRIEGEIAFGFRNHFPDAWYDLLNPDLAPTPMRVGFRTEARSFPKNVDDARIEALVLYLVRADGETAEIDGAELRFSPDGESGSFDGTASTVDGRASTRSASGIGLVPLLGRPVAGQWELALPDETEMENRPRTLLADERIRDILLVVTFGGSESEWES